MLLIAIGFFLNHASNAWFSLYKNRVGAIYSDTTQLFVFCLYPNY